jgi:PX domain
MSISVPDAKICEMNAVQYVSYIIELDFGNNQKYLLPKRFSDIAQLDYDIRSAYQHNHLLGNIPDCPPKYIKLWNDHFAPDFIERRRGDIENYLRKLVTVPKVAENPDFKRFYSTMKLVE